MIVSDLYEEAQESLRNERPLKVEATDQRDHLEVIRENPDQNCLRLVSLRVFHQVARVVRVSVSLLKDITNIEKSRNSHCTKK